MSFAAQAPPHAPPQAPPPPAARALAPPLAPPHAPPQAPPQAPPPPPGQAPRPVVPTILMPTPGPHSPGTIERLGPHAKSRPTVVIPRVERAGSLADNSSSSEEQRSLSDSRSRQASSRPATNFDLGLETKMSGAIDAAPPAWQFSARVSYYNQPLQPLVRLIAEDAAMRRRAKTEPVFERDPTDTTSFLDLGDENIDRCLGLYLGAVSQALARCSCAALRRRGSSPVGLCKLEKNWLENSKDEAYDNAVRRNTCDCGGPPWRASRTRFWRGDAACTRWRSRHIKAVSQQLENTQTARRDATFRRVLLSLSGSARVRFACIRKTKVGHLDPNFLGPALREHCLKPEFLASIKANDAYATGGGFVGLVIERVGCSIALFGSRVVLLVETARFEEAKHGAPPSAVVADSIRYSVDAANQPVLFARTRGAPDQEMWSANAWAALVATLGLGDVACASTKAAVRAFVFGVAESIGVARAA